MTEHRRFLWASLLTAASLVALSIALSRPAKAEVGDKYEMFREHSAKYHVRHVSRGTVIGQRPSQCPARAWCGCWLSIQKFGKNVRNLWLARAWLNIGHPVSAPVPGAIAVYARGRGGHVGVIKRVISPTRIVLLSGNDGGVVRERERSTAGIIGYRKL